MKKKILVSWAAHTFKEIVTPLITLLAKDYEIVITIVNYHMPSDLPDDLSEMAKKKLILSYFVIPDFLRVKEQYMFLIENTRELKSYDFDIWLTGGEMQIYERYLMEHILPKHCISIVFWPGLTYLFAKPELVKKILSDNSPSNSVVKSVNHSEKSWSIKLKEKIKNKGGYAKVFLIIPSILLLRGRYVWILLARKFIEHYSREILPYILLGKTFRYGPYDKLTQLGSARSDAIIFCDPLEAKAHKVLYKSPQIHVSNHPLHGSCRCRGVISGKGAILSPLSGFVGVDRISKEILDKYLRDFKIAVSESKTDSIHLRTHPRETGKWPFQLRDHLVNNGIHAEVVGCTKPIREVLCGYSGMAGLASQALREARASCDYAFVVGFVAVSKRRYTDPKLVYGTGEGIGWIEEDGSYDPDIFSRYKYTPPKRKTVPEILSELIKDKA